MNVLLLITLPAQRFLWFLCLNPSHRMELTWWSGFLPSGDMADDDIGVLGSVPEKEALSLSCALPRIKAFYRLEVMVGSDLDLPSRSEDRTTTLPAFKQSTCSGLAHLVLLPPELSLCFHLPACDPAAHSVGFHTLLCVCLLPIVISFLGE